MIVQIRGTSGSGKSTAMRRVMERLGNWNPLRAAGRKRPIGYELIEDGVPRVAVLGPYETACGGCDAVGSARAVYDEVMKLVSEPHAFPYVLTEGLLLSEDTKWTLQMPDVRAVFLTTPVERCIEWVKGRRVASGNDKPLNEENTRRRVAVIERARTKLLDAGVYCRRASADQAVNVVLRWIREEAEAYA